MAKLEEFEDLILQLGETAVAIEESLSINDALSKAEDSVIKDKSKIPFRTLRRQLKLLGVNLDLSVDLLNNTTVFKTLSTAIYAGKAAGNKGEARSAHTFHESLRTVINKGKSADKANVLQNKNLKTWLDTALPKGGEGLGEARYMPSDDNGYLKATNTSVKNTNMRVEDIIKPWDTAETLAEKIRSGDLKPHIVKAALRDASVKNYFLLHGLTGVRGEEALDITIRPASELDIRKGKRPYRIEDGIIRNIGLKGTTGGGKQVKAGKPYQLGNFHQGVMADQIRIAAINQGLVQSTRSYTPTGQGYKTSFTKELWPVGEKQMHIDLRNRLWPYFKENKVEWLHEDTSVRKPFQVKMLRDQFSRMMKTTVDNDSTRLNAAMGHSQGTVTSKFYSKGGISQNQLDKWNKNLAPNLRKTGYTVASDLDANVKFFYGDVFGDNASDLSMKWGVNTLDTHFASLPIDTSNIEDKMFKFKTTKPGALIVADDITSIEDIESSFRVNREEATKNVTKLQDKFVMGNLEPEIDPKVKTEPDYVQGLKDAFDKHGETGKIRKKKLSQKRKTILGKTSDLTMPTPPTTTVEANQVEIDKAIAETGADINTPSGKAKINKVLGAIGRKLPFVSIPLGTWAASQTLSTPAEAFAAPEEGDLASKLFGLETGEQRQQARAAYQQIETLPFVPMFIPPAEDIFPTEEERRLEEEQTSEQMSALFTGA